MGNFQELICDDKTQQSWLGAGLAAFALSLLLPCMKSMSSSMFGWEALQISLLPFIGFDMGKDAGPIWMAGMTNILLVTIPTVLKLKPAAGGKITIFAAAFCVFVTINFFFKTNDLFVGYYLWVTSALFTLFGAICVDCSRRSKITPPQLITLLSNRHYYRIITNKGLS